MHHVHILWKYCKLADAKDPCKSHDVSLSLPSKHDIIEMIIWPKFQKDVVMKRSIIILDDPQSYSGKREVHFSGSNSKAIPRQGRSLHIGLEGRLNFWFSSNFKMEIFHWNDYFTLISKRCCHEMEHHHTRWSIGLFGQKGSPFFRVEL